MIGGASVLVAAKAHLDEFFSPATAAKGAPRDKIAVALGETRAALAAKGGADWMERFYQFTNRLAHLHFLRREACPGPRSGGVPALLVFVNFIGDDDMGGPAGAAEWEGAFRTAEYAFGLPPSKSDVSDLDHPGSHALSPFIRHVHIDVRELAG
ncbi:MAG: hypothetical protein ACWA6X_12355 [Bauldia sp.]